MSLYQSELWRYITEHIYKKPVFELSLNGETYQGIMKIKKKRRKTFRRFMVHGVGLGDTTYFNQELKENLQRIKRDFGTGSTDIFFQIGCDDVFAEHVTSSLKECDELESDILKKRHYIQSDFWQWYDLKPTVREHMPEATIFIDLLQESTVLRKNLSSSGKRYVNKGERAGLVLERAEGRDDWETYRHTRQSMAYDKRFSVLPKDTFLTLCDYLSETDQGSLFLAKKDGMLASGMLCLTTDTTVYYLYGATDRAFGSIGAQYRLTRKVIEWYCEAGYKTLDLLGVAPTGVRDHYLSGVTRYKQAFGGITQDYVGNYDLILHARLYRARKARKGI